MLEVELKFQIPEARRRAVQKTLESKDTETIQLKAKYYDTTDHLLSKNGAALRQRLEGTHWVQTLKAATKTHIARFEHNHDLGEQDSSPALDLEIYKNNAQATEILNTALGDQASDLKLQFETDITRTSKIIHFNDADIEVSLDIGEIRAENAKHDVYEIEFELKQGSAESLLAFSFEWVKKYHLWLDVRSKAEIGNLLVLNHKVSPAKTAKEFIFNKKNSADQNLRSLISDQLQHLLPNIAAISAQVAEQEHIDQAHIALNHLHLTLSILRDWSEDIVDKWSVQLAAFKSHFENLRHFEHMQNTLSTLLQNPNTASSLSKDILYAKEKLFNLVCSTQNVQHFLQLLIFSLGQAKQPQKHDLKWYAQNTLQHQYKQLQDALNNADISDFESLDELAKHLNELKFSFPLLTNIYDVKNLQKYGKALNEAQHAAEQYQVLASSASYLQETELEASDWFALGWLTAKQENYAQVFLDATEQFLLSRKFLK
nr:CYTH domain-containing protein [Acinetobacter sp. Marseille-Q1620]